MEKSKPVQINVFVLCWVLAALLLYPLVIIIVMLVYRLLVNQLPLVEAFSAVFERFGSPWYREPDLLAAMFVVFTAAMAYVQRRLFARLLHVTIRHWAAATIIGGWVGTFLMISLKLTAPFYMLPWFAALSLAQWWTIRQTAARAWLWIVAHVALSVLFPIWGTGLPLIARWCVAMLIYAASILLVMERLAQNARWDKAKHKA